MSNSPINVIVAMDFSDAIIERIRAVSPRLRVERHFPDVPDKAWAEAEVLYSVRNFPEPTQAPRLRWIQMHSAGVDHAITQPIVQAEDVEITNMSGVHAVQMAEYCVMMMTAFAYNLPLMMQMQRTAEWPANQHKAFSPMTLRGQTLGIVGYGAVGRELARMADALGMSVLAIKRDVMHPEDFETYRIEGTGNPEGDIPLRLYPPQAVLSMAQACDFLVLIAPLTDNSRHMVTSEVLEAMKKTAVLVNVARGAVVDEGALITALSSGQIAGAALDVFETEPLPSTSPLWGMENVIISPHVAGNVANYHERTADVFIENLERYVNNRPLLNRVQREWGY
jgi:phosphoglycerate dehydrogenase-like enzyme